MKQWLALAALLFGLATLAAGATPARHAARPAADWTRVVAATPEGGLRMGNPRAKVRLVEYFSYTCPHCAAFSGEAGAPIAADVRGGQLSYEIRSALRERLDYVAAMLARCAGPAHAFPLTAAILADQSSWYPRAADYDAEHPADLLGAGGGIAAAAIVTQSGLDAIAAKAGVAMAMLPRCLGDPAARTAVQATTKDAWETRRIDGTPAFFINDAPQPHVYGWAALEPLLNAALKG